MRVVDWPGLLRDTGAAWETALTRCGRRSVSLEIEGTTYGLALEGGRLRVDGTRDPGCHVRIPDGWGPALLTGQRDAEDLLFASDGGPSEVLRALFPGGTTMWTCAPAFDLADE